MRGLTKQQTAILDAIRRFIDENGHSPSVRDLASAAGISSSTAQQHLIALERKGRVRRTGGAFGLEVIDTERAGPGELVDVPVLGTIAAGEPIEAVEQHDDTLPIARSLLSGTCYFLRVRGDSMRDDLILDGDLVLVRRQETVDNGEIAVALLEDGSATLKRVYRERARFRLQPANETMEPIYVKRLRVQGKVVCVLRTF